MGFLLGIQDGHFLFNGDVSEGTLVGKTIHLGLRKRVSPPQFNGILGGDNEEEIPKRIALPFDRDLLLGHRLEHGTLGPGRGPIDFVGEHDIRKDWSALKLKFPPAGIEDTHSEEVGRQEVGSELNPLEIRAPHRSRDRFGEGRFSGSGNILEQDVTAGHHRRQHPSNGLLLSQHDLFDGGLETLCDLRGLLHHWSAASRSRFHFSQIGRAVFWCHLRSSEIAAKSS